jgi:hypothetical protein
MLAIDGESCIEPLFDNESFTTRSLAITLGQKSKEITLED